MTDHRNLQRTLFRMQIDPSFCRSILDGDAAALATTGLDAHSRSLLASVEARAVLADPGGKRRLQVLGNAASEYVVTLVAAAADERSTSLLADFGSSPEFHTAMTSERGLPVAFGEHALRHATETRDTLLGALATLELALVQLRRASC